MTIRLYTDDESALDLFHALRRSGSYRVEVRRSDDLVCDDGQLGFDGVIYIDAGAYARPELRRVIQLLEQDGARFGILDITDTVDDVAELFHLGAIDYVGGRVIQAGLSTSRMRRVLEFGTERPPQKPRSQVERSSGGASERDDRGSAFSWDQVHDGEEYEFMLLYAGLDPITDVHRESTVRTINDARNSFRDFLERYFGAVQGRLYMWKEDEGVLLFPFHDDHVDPIVYCFRMMINSILINAERLSVPTPVTWRLALHAGTTTYRAHGRTQTIVSEAVNHIFHIGSIYLEPSSFAITGPIMAMVPDGLRPYFVSDGTYERSSMYRMVPPISD